MNMKKITTTSRNTPSVAEDNAAKKYLRTQNKSSSSIPHFIRAPSAHSFVAAVLPVVSATHAGVQPFAVVIEVLHALVAHPTVFDFRAPKLRFIVCISWNGTFSWLPIDTWQYHFGYLHLDITQVTVQVLDDVQLLRPVKERHWTGIALFGPDTGICRVYSYGSNVAEKVHNKCYRRQLCSEI